MPAYLVHCSCPDSDTATRLAKSAVQARLAACATALPGAVSTYRWEGEIETADEVVLLLKTTQAAWPALRELLREAHPYELPEIIAVEIVAGLPGYLEWVASETTTPPAATPKDPPV
ncbi:divalent-cation tolerance protein CutA [Alkalisalibacterium limincola]|uniref:Divalent-cation tolerance protein CutA n=1 Tax=Alkalisalibacterium limincola TaxID=2699169 RepID=A0A5C8KMN1_9GAMM|nr:divalent-cation tolerance protein CutA [Alkalisalibacterium limincola]TXK61061.1 divalent-cation tolerance protein CutA [Alkalisalibacterium limincola]